MSKKVIDKPINTSNTADNSNSKPQALDTKQRASNSNSLDTELKGNTVLTSNILFKTFIEQYLHEHPHNEHHHNSFKSLIGPNGIASIITSQFEIRETMTNTKLDTPEDREIATIDFSVKFKNVNIKKPLIVVGNKEEVLTPHKAVTNGMTYSSAVVVDIKFHATAYKHNGEIFAEYDKESPNIEIASIPIMVRSEKCNTYMNTPDELIMKFEDPNDSGGYFITKGREVCLCNMESVQYNFIRINKPETPYEGELARGLIISKPGDSFENSCMLTVKYMVNKGIFIDIGSNYFQNLSIPFYLFYRIFGIVADEDIINTIVYDTTYKNGLTQQLVRMVAYAIKEAPVAEVFESIQNSRNPKEIAQYLSNYLSIYKRINEKKSDSKTKATRSKAKAAATAASNVATTTTATDKKSSTPTLLYDMFDDNMMRANNTVLFNKLDTCLLPHMGDTADDRVNKIRYLGYLIRQVLLGYLGVIETTEQNSYFTNRINTPGITYAKTFKSSFNKVVIIPARNKLKQVFAQSSFTAVNMETAFKTNIKPGELIKAMVSSIINGRDVVSSVTKAVIANRIRSINLEHKNLIYDISAFITIDKNTAVKQQGSNVKIMEQRSVHQSYLGYVCLFQSSDTGDKVGKIKQKAILARITNGSSSEVLVRILLEDADIEDLSNVADVEIVRNKMSRIFVNGKWIALTRVNSFLLAQKYKLMRRDGKIHFETTIYVEPMTTDLRFFTDPGRLIRPLFIVYGYGTAAGQDIKFTDKHARDIVTGQVKLADLERAHVYEYIAPDELDNTLIAESYETLLRNRHSKIYRYTHCEIEQSLYGLLALCTPFANRIQAQRSTIFTNQIKQACGYPTLTYSTRISKKGYIMYNVQAPLVKTLVNSFVYEHGANLIVAYMGFECRNQEDCSVMNLSSAERGQMGVTYYTYSKVILEKNYTIKRPRDVGAIERDRANYDKLGPDGIVQVGTIIRQNDVIIGCVESVHKDSNTIVYIDKSEIHKQLEELTVVSIQQSVNDEGKLFVNVALCGHRPLSVGSKISSRHGNKSVIGANFQQRDLPFTRSGVIPDLIITNHGFPKRMILSQLLEAAVGKLCAKRGITVDATAFTHIDLTELRDEMDANGIKFMGYEPMYDGRTGEEFNALICVCPTYYMRLQKFPNDSVHSIAKGAINVVTRQPVKGRRNDGGLRLGEMEKDALGAHGAMSVIYEKFFLHSDKYTRYFCRNCGLPAIYNQSTGQYKCKTCKDRVSIYSVNSTWMTNIIHQDLNGAHISMRYNPKKLEFYN